MASIKALMARVKAALEDRKNQTWMLLGSLTLYVIVAGVAAGMFSKVPRKRIEITSFISAESVLGISWIVCFIELIVFVVRKYKAQPLLPNGRGKRLLIVLVNRVLLILVQGCTGAAEGLPSFLLKTSSSRDAHRRTRGDTGE
ncbi:hypothetical protein EJB05_21686, partial [Eragrostis curvula]